MYNSMSILDGTTLDIIAGIVNQRETIQMALTDFEDTQQRNDEAQRDIDQVELITIKNNCWKDISWIVRSTHTGATGG